MLKNLTRYIKNIKNKAIKYESLDANGDNIDRYQIVLKRVVIWSIAVVLLSSGLTGVSDRFINFTGCILSIFIGLFITALLFAFDKIGIKQEKENQKISPKAINILKDTQEYNFAKQCIYILGYNVILCTFVLILILFCVCFDSLMSFNLLDYEFTYISITSTWIFVQGIIVICIRFFIFYYLIHIFYYTLYAISSLINMMTIKRNRQND